MAPQPSTSHSMGNLLTMPRHNVGYQERLVDWNLEPAPIPGATVNQLTSSKSPYFNHYDYTNVTYPNQSMSGKLMARSPTGNNSSCLSMYPIDEAPHDEDYQRSREAWTTNKRPIPIIHEPNQMFLTIPSHNERYPPYPSRNNFQVQSRDPQYGYYSKDKTELTFPALNRSQDSLNSPDTVRETFTYDSEVTIPFIDQLDEAYEASSQSKTNTINDHCDYDRQGSIRDSNNVHINLMKCRHIQGRSQSIPSRPSSAMQQRSRNDIDERTMRTNSLDRNSGEFKLDLSTPSTNVIVTHCCCHGHLKHCQEHNETPNENSQDGSVSPESEKTPPMATPKMHTIMPELNLDLSGLNSESSSEDSNAQEKCWKSPEEVRLGCGRVAALAKHFSKLGEAGLIRFKSIKLNASRQFVSEPDIASPRSPEISGHRRSARKEYKSETDLLKADKSVATTPEKEWSMILLDIQARNELDLEKFYENKDGRDKQEGNSCSEDNIDNEPGELKKSGSKLSLAEQNEIIEQLKEFANLDNADAPLFIPEQDEPISGSSSVKETMTESIDSSDNSQANVMEIPRYGKMIGRMRLEHFRKNSLPTILGTLNISPGFESTKINKLEKYWSVKDLMSNDDVRNEITNDVNVSPKYFIFPTCSRVVSAPEISNDDINIFHTQSLNSSTASGNVTIRSTISISEENVEEQGNESETDQSVTETKERASSPIIFRDVIKDEKKTKFPASFIRTRKLSKSHEGLFQKNPVNLTEFKKIPVCRSLDKMPIPKSTIPLHSCKTVDAARVKDRCRHNSDHYNTIPIKTNSKVAKPIRKKSLIMRRISKSDMDVSERKPTPRFERGDWIFREFPPLENSAESRKLADYDIDVSLCLHSAWLSF